MKKESVSTFEVEGIKYYKHSKRMLYNPEFHDNHGEKWDKEDIAYMIQMRPAMKWKDISLALGRTQNTCMAKYHSLKKRGLLDYYRRIEI